MRHLGRAVELETGIECVLESGRSVNWGILRILALLLAFGRIQYVRNDSSPTFKIQWLNSRNILPFLTKHLKSRTFNDCCFAPRKGSRWPEALHLLQTFATSKGSVDVVMYNAAPRPSDVGWLESNRVKK